MFQRILVPLDGSARAERAIPVAARLAQASGGSITLLRVVASPLGLVWRAPEVSTSMQEVDAERARAAGYLARVAAWDAFAGITTTTEVLEGTPATCILSVARSQQSDIIILCSHGYTGMTLRVLGSTAKKLAFHAPIPVLVLREGGPVPAHPRLDDAYPLRILVALDGSTLAEKAIEPAACLVAALAAPTLGAMHLVQVVKPATTASEARALDAGHESMAILHKAKKYLGATVDHLREGRMVPPVADLKISITWSVAVDDDVASALIKVAENGEDAEGAGVFGGCAIIAMATHGYSGISRWAIGSITERVLEASSLPLLIVRPPDMMERSNFTWDMLIGSAI
jgi:nucleotide-binding universal stress UspA family protein